MSWLETIKISISALAVALTAIVVLFGNDWFRKRRERFESYDERINSFHRPILQAFTTSKMLRDVLEKLLKQKPSNFRTLPYLIENKGSIPSSEQKIINEIVAVGKEIERLINENAGMIFDHNLREEVGALARHIRIFRFVAENASKTDDASYESEAFKEFVYPREVNDLIEREYRVILDTLKGDIFSKLRNTSDVKCKKNICHICGQLQGDPHSDLIHQILGEPRNSYKKRIFLEGNNFGVIPSIGPLVLGHVLIVPKTHIYSTSQISGSLFLDYKKEVRNVLLEVFPEEGQGVHFFEHGNSRKLKRTLCSTEHAHLHAFPSRIENYVAKTASKVDFWNFTDIDHCCIADKVRDSEYLYYETPNGKTYLKVVKNGAIDSQYFRRLVAEVNGNSMTWNWKLFPKRELLIETIRRLELMQNCRMRETASAKYLANASEGVA